MTAVDIIIPLYNKAATVQAAIRSVQSQTFTDWRLFVVDDGSTDQSPQIVHQMCQQDSRIELIVQPNAGPGAARNAGIRAATAAYLAFLDADDQWYPWHLETAMTAIQTNPVALVGTTYYEWPQRTDVRKYWAQRRISPGTYQIHGNETAEFAEAFIVLFHVNTTVVRTEIARRYGGFYEHGCRHGEDLIFFAKIIFNETFTLVGGKPTARYNRQHSELTAVVNDSLNPMLLEPEILLKYCSIEKQHLARQVLARMALRNAFIKARNGYKEVALRLVALHPQMKNCGWAWCQCQFAITFSKVLPYWVRFKCRVGPPVRRFCRQLAYKLHLLRPPPVIPEVDSTESKT